MNTSTNAKANESLTTSLPDDPVDGYKIEYYEIAQMTLTFYRYVLTYHVNTKWSDYSPGERGGADLVDTWMISEQCIGLDGKNEGVARDIGRWDRWKAPLKVGGHHSARYATLEQAIAAMINYCEQVSESLSDRLLKLTTAIRTLRGLKNRVCEVVILERIVS